MGKQKLLVPLSKSREGLLAKEWGRRFWTYAFVYFHPKRELSEEEQNIRLNTWPENDPIYPLRIFQTVLWCSKCRNFMSQKLVQDTPKLLNEINKKSVTSTAYQKILFTWMFNLKKSVNQHLKKPEIFQFHTVQQALSCFDGYWDDYPTFIHQTSLWLMYLTAFNYPPEIDKENKRDIELYEKSPEIIDFFIHYGEFEKPSGISKQPWNSRLNFVIYIYQLDRYNNYGNQSIYGEDINNVVHYFESTFRA